MTAKAPRLLLYGLQSSGASLIAFLAAQGKDTLAVVDLWNPEVAPRLEHDGPIVVKATAGPVALDDHLHTYEPTHTVLVLRNPLDQISVLDGESFRDYATPLVQKLELFDRVVAERIDEFDLVLRYETVVTRPADAVDSLNALGLGLPSNADAFPRSLSTVVREACEWSPWCRENWRVRWGTGRIDVASFPLQRSPVDQISDAVTLAAKHCPTVLARYC